MTWLVSISMLVLVGFMFNRYLSYRENTKKENGNNEKTNN